MDCVLQRRVCRVAQLLFAAAVMVVMITSAPANTLAQCREDCVDLPGGGFASDPNTTYNCCLDGGGTWSPLPPATTPGDACDEHHPGIACPATFKWYSQYGCLLLGGEEENFRCNASDFTRTEKRAYGACGWTVEGGTTCTPTVDPADPGQQVTLFECGACR